METTPYIHTNLIEPYEFILAQVYILFILFFSLIIRRIFYKNSPLKKYYLPAITAKLIGAVGVTLIYNFYYEGGDTCHYFHSSHALADLMIYQPSIGFQLLFTKAGNFPPELLYYVPKTEFVLSESSYLILKISAFLQLFAFKSFLTTAILFGYLSFFAVWKLFVVFYEYYPELKKEFAIAFLFLPSVCFWGSGILKDTICLASLALFFVCIDRFFFKGKKNIKYAIGLIITAYVLITVKVYIIMSFTICIVFLVFLTVRSRIKNGFIRIFVAPFFLFGALTLAYYLVVFISQSTTTQRYTLDNIIQTAQVTRDYIYSAGGGSSYSLGEIENSTWGLVKVFPAGVNVTLFRPYIWEINSIISSIAALESLWIFYITIITLIKTKIINFFSIASSNNITLFCLIFALLFAYFVGITSGNFGTLVRYKIPCIPFYISAIYLISYHSKLKDRTPILSLRKQ